jgi:hypothetical protein
LALSYEKYIESWQLSICEQVGMEGKDRVPDMAAKIISENILGDCEELPKMSETLRYFVKAAE